MGTIGYPSVANPDGSPLAPTAMRRMFRGQPSMHQRPACVDQRRFENAVGARGCMKRRGTDFAQSARWPCTQTGPTQTPSSMGNPARFRHYTPGVPMALAAVMCRSREARGHHLEKESQRTATCAKGHGAGMHSAKPDSHGAKCGSAIVRTLRAVANAEAKPSLRSCQRCGANCAMRLLTNCQRRALQGQAW